MIVGPTSQQLADWKSNLHHYQKHKRTRKPFQKNNYSVEINRPAIQQPKLNPILQNYKTNSQKQKTNQKQKMKQVNQKLTHLKNNYQYSQKYDILNFNPSVSLPQQMKYHTISHENRKKQYKDPIVNTFDLLNGKDYNGDYLKQRWVKPQRKFNRIIHKHEVDKRNFDIVNCHYREDDPSMHSSEGSQFRNKSMQKFNQSHVFDNLNKDSSNPEQPPLRKRFYQKLPSSYNNRQPLILDQTAPLPQIIKNLDNQQQSKKTRYKQRYDIQHQYSQRNNYHDHLKQQQTTNRIHNNHILTEKAREFNILSNSNLEKDRVQKLFRKSGVQDVQSCRLRGHKQYLIKHEGFKFVT